ncbi:MAG: TrkA family potassium uptake protein [Rectinema sp.]
MKYYAFIGLGALSMNMLESIAQVTDQIVVVDIDPASVDRVKDYVKTAYVADATDEGALERILPDNLDVAVVDMAGNIEASILVTHMLRKKGVPEIIVKAESEDKGEILEIVGATRVVHSDKEAAARIVPLILSSSLYNYMPIGGELVMAEVLIPSRLAGMSLMEADLRRKNGINVVALRSENSVQYRDFDRDYRLTADDVLLVAGKEADIFAFSGISFATPRHSEKRDLNIFKKIFKGEFKGKAVKSSKNGE